MAAIYSDVIEGAAFIDRGVMRATEEAVERARVVGVLDASFDGMSFQWASSETGCTLWFPDGTSRTFQGSTPDAARAAAAKAIEAGEV